jgi:hypothetical protein
MNEFQNAFALSQMERQRDDPRIETELAQGKYVVVMWHEQYCRFTDAQLPDYKTMMSSWWTKEMAEGYLANQKDLSPDRLPHTIEVEILHREKQKEIIPTQDDDVPF